MKQLLFMIAMTCVGTLGVFINPFYSVAVYYLFAVLRPQFMWQWSLPQGVQWSMFVAVVAIVAATAKWLGFEMSTSHSEPRAAAERRRSGPVGIALFAFALWIVVTSFTAYSFETASRWLTEYLKIFVMFFAGTVLVSKIRYAWVLMIIAATALGYIAYEINYLYFVNGYLGIQRNGYGGLDNNGAGLMLAMGVPLCLYVWIGSSRWWRWVYLGLVPVLIHAVLMTYSRGAMVSLIAVTPLIMARSRHKLQMGLATLCLIAIVPAMAGNEIRNRFFSIEQYEQDGSAQSRLDSWAAAWEMAKDYPVFGVGVRNSQLFARQYGTDRQGRAIHSQYLQILADTGFPGLLLYLTVILSAWLTLMRVRRVYRQVGSEEARQVVAMAGGVEVSLATFCVGALFLSLEVFELPYLLLLISAALGRLATATTEVARPDVAKSLSRRALARYPATS